MMPKAIRPRPEMTVMVWWTRGPASRRTRVMAVDKSVNQVAVPRPMPARSGTAAAVVWVMRAVEAAAKTAAQDVMVRGFGAVAASAVR